MPIISRRKVRPPVRYPGSKNKVANTIIEFLPQGEEYREPFCGSGAIFFALKSKKPVFKRYWLNDLDTGLMHLFGSLRDDSKLIERARAIAPPMENEPLTERGPRNGRRKNARLAALFEKFKTRTNVDALAYLFVNQTCFGSGRIRTDIGPGRICMGNEESWAALLKTTRLEDCAKALRNVKLTCLDYTDVLNEPGQNVVCYLDPPYETNSKLLRRNQLYQHSFTPHDHVTLAEIVKNCPHRCVVSYNDSPFVRQLYKGCDIQALQWRYLGHAKRRMGNELIIRNY